MALRGDAMGYHARHEARCHGPHLRCFPDSHDLRGSLHRDALVLMEGQADNAKCFHLFLAARLQPRRGNPPPLALSPRHGDNVRLHLVQHSSMAGAPIQVLAGRRIGLGPSKQFASQLS